MTIHDLPKYDNPEGWWYPLTIDESKSLMQRIAHALGDKVIFPTKTTHVAEDGEIVNLDRMYAYDAEDGEIVNLDRVFAYDTENGGIFYVDEYVGDDNLVSSIGFQTTINVPYEEHKEFIKSFMENANLKHYEIGDDLPIQTIVYNVGSYSSILFTWGFYDGVMISFGPWTNHPELVDTSNLIDEKEIIKIAKKFVAKHRHLYDIEECTTVKIYDDNMHVFLHIRDGGIPVYEVTSHSCEYFEWWYMFRDESVWIDAITGKHAWFDPDYLNLNWKDELVLDWFKD